jgi:hypothetical protein
VWFYSLINLIKAAWIKMNNSFGLKEHDPSILSSTKMETVAHF